MSWMCNIPKLEEGCEDIRSLQYTAFKTKVSKAIAAESQSEQKHADEVTALRAAHEKEIEALNMQMSMQKAVMARDLHTAERQAEEATSKAQDLEAEVKMLHRALYNQKATAAHELNEAQMTAENALRRSLELAKEVERLSKAFSTQKTSTTSEVQNAQATAEAAFKRAWEAEKLFEQMQTKNTELMSLLEQTQARSEEYRHRISSLEAEKASMREEHEAQLEVLRDRHDALKEELENERELIAFSTRLFEDLGREQAARKKLHNDMEELKGKIRVYVRIRPMSTQEIDYKYREAIFPETATSVVIKGIGFPDAVKTYEFDKVFCGSDEDGCGSTQEDVFRDTKHLITSVVDGYNVCVFAYGQTGSGKTFTMIGGVDLSQSMLPSGEFASSAGILPRAVVELFRLLDERHTQVRAQVEVQMFQLYKDRLEDLLGSSNGLNGKKKRGKENTGTSGTANSDTNGSNNLRIVLAEHSASGLVEVEGAAKVVGESAAEVLQIISTGASRRSTASTLLNTESSRSHLVCVLVVRLENRRSKVTTVGKLTLVDLAGSERVDKSGATGEMLKEAQSINKSLSALGGVIAAVSTGSNHVPYRDHPLTMLMSDSIGGNAKTLMFVNCSPADSNNYESNNSLSFGSRCKDITNTIGTLGSGNQQYVISNLKKEIIRLKRAESSRSLG